MATIASVESQIFIKTGKLEELSVQEIMDCSADYGTFGCGGGIVYQVYQYIKENGGVSREQDYPYEGKLGKCRKNQKNKVVIDFEGYGLVKPKNDEILMEALEKRGPLLISLDIDHKSFMLYSSGIYHEPNCQKHYNHAALLVGFGTENGIDYWLVNNSFGDKWGESGYIRIKRGTGDDCHVNVLPMFVVLND
jgi:C1A family cysteine protease